MRQVIDPIVGVLAALVFAGIYGGTFRPPPPRPQPQEAIVVDNLCSGLNLMRQGRYEWAEAQLQKAADSGQDPQLALERMAECQFYLGNTSAALATCDQIKKRFPNSGRAYHIRGLVFEKIGEPDKAHAEFRIAVTHGEKTSLYHLPGG